MKKFLFSIILFISWGVFSADLWAKDISYPAPSGYVNDFAGILTPQDAQLIDTYAKELDQKTSVQLAVVTVESTQPETIEQYAAELFKKWGIGQKGKDNGVLFIIAAKDHALKIEVGYGLEGVLTDAMSSTIIRQVIIPEFKEGHPSQGVLQGSKVIVSLIAKENGVTITGQESEVYKEFSQDSSGLWLIVLVFIFIFIFFLMSFSTKNQRGWKDRYYGGGGFGGGGFSGGGGFGGFGGGGSGGGGASGRW